MIRLGQTVVYYTTGEEKKLMRDGISKNDREQLAAIVVGVNDDKTFNLLVFEDGIRQFHKTNVTEGIEEGQFN